MKLPNKLLITSLSIIILVLIGYGVFVRQCNTQANPPRISVSIRIEEINRNSVTLLWKIKNESKQPVTFDENGIMQIKLNGQAVDYPTEAKTLKPGEETCIDLELVADMEKINVVKITAATNEGTTATMSQTIYPS